MNTCTIFIFTVLEKGLVGRKYVSIGIKFYIFTCAYIYYCMCVHERTAAVFLMLSPCPFNVFASLIENVLHSLHSGLH